MSNTKSRDIGYNSITSVEAGAFSGLTALTELLSLQFINDTICHYHYDCRNREYRNNTAYI